LIAPQPLDPPATKPPFAVDQPGAGLRADRVVLHRHDRVEQAEIEQHAARERHGLTVIAGAGAARGERQAVRHTIARHIDKLRDIGGHHDDVGQYVIEFGLEDRREPVIIARLALARAGRALAADRREIGRDAIPVDCRLSNHGFGDDAHAASCLP
jgi:hypothetical protein